MKNENKLMGAGILAAIAASLCCITPLLALLAGTSGLASTFSWLEPFRPYLIGISVLVLGFAWWQKLSPRKSAEADCDCDDEEKPSFWQSKKFLGIITVFAVIMMALPYYSHIFYPENETETVSVNSGTVKQVQFVVDGMTCTGCEEHIKQAVSETPGLIHVSASYEEGLATVKLDTSKTNVQDIVKAINRTGYTVSGHQIIE